MRYLPGFALPVDKALPGRAPPTHPCTPRERLVDGLERASTECLRER